MYCRATARSAARREARAADGRFKLRRSAAGIGLAAQSIASVHRRWKSSSGIAAGCGGQEEKSARHPYAVPPHPGSGGTGDTTTEFHGACLEARDQEWATYAARCRERSLCSFPVSRASRRTRRVENPRPRSTRVTPLHGWWGNTSWTEPDDLSRRLSRAAEITGTYSVACGPCTPICVRCSPTPLAGLASLPGTWSRGSGRPGGGIPFSLIVRPAAAALGKVSTGRAVESVEAKVANPSTSGRSNLCAMAGVCHARELA